jgi:nucleotide-binding universal stress UspA family protein
VTPSDYVVQVAQRRDARLVVLGLRARTAVGKLVFGSTAQRILLDATCPVLAVKPNVAGP